MGRFVRRGASMLVAGGLLTVGGCATPDAPDTRFSSAWPQTPALPATATPCPPAGDSVLQRNLTVPFAHRRYLLPDGTLCEPGRGVARGRQPVSAGRLATHAGR